MSAVPSDRLLTLPPIRSAIPTPVLAVIGIGCICLIAQQGYKYWAAKKRAAEVARNVVVEEPPEVAWERALGEWASRKAATQAEGLTLARISMGKLPVLWGGWTLERASCRVHDPVADQANVKRLTRTWSCAATYNRAPGALVNRDMTALLPKEWTVKYVPLDAMEATWSIAQQVDPMSPLAFKPIQFHYVDTTSRLQELAAAFSQDVKFAFEPLQIPAPKRHDGSSVPMTNSVAALVQAPISIRAPLRTVDALIDKGLEVDWTALAITYGAAQGKLGIRSSAVAAEISGVMYAKR